MLTPATFTAALLFASLQAARKAADSVYPFFLRLFATLHITDLLYITAAPFRLLSVFVFLTVYIIKDFLYNVNSFLKDFSIIKDINCFMNENIDSRDDNKFIVTHIFLMTGLISSLYYNNEDNSAFNYLSIIVLGIGDAMTAICGVYFGKTKIYSLNLRTLEGSLGGLIPSVLLYYFFKGSINMNELIKFILIFLYEGYTLEVDNLFLPLLSNNLFLNSGLIKEKILNKFI